VGGVGGMGVAVDDWGMRSIHGVAQKVSIAGWGARKLRRIEYSHGQH